MIATSQAWKDNQNKQVRSESNVRITATYSTFSYVLNKTQLQKLNIKESGSISNDKLTISDIYFECFKNNEFAKNVDERFNCKIEFGYFINGSWEWITKGIYKTKKKEMRANGLIASFTLVPTFKNGTKNIEDTYRYGTNKYLDVRRTSPIEPIERFCYLQEMIRYSGTSYYNSNAICGSILFNSAINSSLFCSEGLGLVSYNELARQLALCVNMVYRFSNNGNINYFDIAKQTNPSFTIIFENCYEKPELTYNLQFDDIILQTYKCDSAATSSSQNITINWHNTFNIGSAFVEPAKYKSVNSQYFAGNQVWDTEGTHTFNFYEMTSEQSFYPSSDTQVSSELSNVLTINCVLFRTDWNTTDKDKIISYQKYANNHNENYDVKCRIDPSLELFDLIELEIEKGVFKQGFIESIDIDYNGGFNGSIRIRTLFDYEKPLTLKNVSENSATFMTTFGGNANPNLQYSINGGSWTTYSTSGTQLTLPANSTISLRGTNASGFSSSSTDYVYFSCDQECEISGNLMTLIDPSGETTEIPNNYCFYGLFTGIKTISNIPSNLLSATTLKDYCYASLFDGGLNATTKAVHGIVNLVIPSQVISAYVFYYMFRSQAFDDDLTIDFRQATTINSSIQLGAISKEISGITYFVKKTYIFSKALTTINATTIGVTGDVSLQKLVFEFDESDTVSFDVSKIIPQGTDNKSSCAFEIWTDNSSIVLGCIAKRNEYTTVNCYHLDGTAWVEPTPQLSTPTISLSGSTLTINTVANAQYYDIYVDATLNTSISSLTFDLSTLSLSAGTHTIQVKARATGYLDSEFSNSVNYVVSSSFSVTITIQSQTSTGSKYGFYVYDGQDDTGTLLFSEFDRYPSGAVTTTVTCTSGNLYIQMSGGIVVFMGSATGGVTPATFNEYGQDHQLFTVSGNGTITFTEIDWDD